MRTFKKCVLLAVCALLAVAGPAEANLIKNPGFEMDFNGDLNPDFWVRSGLDRVKDDDLGITPYEGSFQFQLQSTGSLTQQVTVPTAGQHDLSMWIASRPHGSHHLGPIGNNEVKLQLLDASNAVVVPDSEVTGDYDSPRGTYVEWTRTYNSLAAGTYTLELRSDGPGGGANQGMVDAFSLVGPPGPPPPPPPVNEVIVDDTFGDGNIGTNTDGTGTGFNTFTAGGGAVTESGGSTVLLMSPVNGARRAGITGKDTIVANDTTTTRLVYEIDSIRDLFSTAGSGPLSCFALGLRQGASHGDIASNSALGLGFYITLEDNNPFDGSPWDGTSSFYYISAGNARTTLATWNFDTVDLLQQAAGSNPLTITLDLTKDTYALSITGDTRDGGQPIAFSGTNAAFGGDHGVNAGRLFAHNQTEDPDIELSFARVQAIQNYQANPIPEPVTVALTALAVCGLGGYVRKRRTD